MFVFTYVLFDVFLVSCTLPHLLFVFFFLMIRRPPRSTLDRSSAASDVYKRQRLLFVIYGVGFAILAAIIAWMNLHALRKADALQPVSYTHLRAHETVLDLVCRLLLEKKKT